MNHAAHILLVFTIAGLQAGFGGGCGDDGTPPEEGVVLTLVANTQFNTEQQLLDRVVAFEFLLDATDGFDNLPAGPTQAHGFDIDDFDLDGLDELLFWVDVEIQDGLPSGRIQAGSNAHKEIAVRVRGLDGNQNVVALGSLNAQVLFRPGELVTKTIPVHLLSRYLPPRIVAVTPSAAPTFGGLGAIAFHTSKPLDPATLEGRVHVYEAGKESQTFEGNLSGPLACPFGTEMWTFSPSDCHGEFMEFNGIGLTLDPGITDRDGLELRNGTGGTGYKTVIGGGFIQFFGRGCMIPILCYESNELMPENPDVFCDRFGTEMFEPTPCTVVQGGCASPLDTFSWVPADSDGTCKSFWEHARYHDDGCVLDLSTGDHCSGGTCDRDAQACLGTDCFWRMGGCQPNCLSFGCPEFHQECLPGEAGGNTCQ